MIRKGVILVLTGLALAVLVAATISFHQNIVIRAREAALRDARPGRSHDRFKWRIDNGCRMWDGGTGPTTPPQRRAPRISVTQP